MKKLLFTAVSALAMTSCSFIANTSTYDRVDVVAIAPVIADLDVSDTKVTYVYSPVPSSVSAMGKENTINTAVKEALFQNGNADVLVGLETQIKYYGTGNIESVVVTGYPAKYTNFRSAGDNPLIWEYMLKYNDTNNKPKTKRK